MAIKTIVFDFRDSETEYFQHHDMKSFDITFIKGSLNDKTVKNIPQDIADSVQAISVFIDSAITFEVLEHFKNLRIVSTRSTGVDHINLRACQKRNIAVLNVENYGSTSVSQYTIGLMIALVRQIPAAAAYNRTEPEDRVCREFVGRDLSKMSVGIVGTGATGAVVAKVAKSFGMEVFAFDINPKKELKIKYTDLTSLIKKSDIITLHLPYTGDNLHMFSKREFDMMHGYLINTSRGELVNTMDLYDALKNGHVKGAALDVLPCEHYNFACRQLAKNGNKEIETISPSHSCVKEVETARKLVKLENVIITPHIAYETQDSIDFILKETFAGIMDYITGGNKHRVV